MYINDNNVTYFDSFEVEYVKKKKCNREQKYHNKYFFIQAYDLIICGYFSNGFIDFMLKGESFLDYIIILKCFE